MHKSYDAFTDFVLDQLADLRELTCRAMFGGYGIYRGAAFFGIVHKGRLYFKTTDANRAAYVARGMKPFRPNAKQTLTTYYEVPVEIIEDAERLTTWASQAGSYNGTIHRVKTRLPQTVRTRRR